MKRPPLIPCDCCGGSGEVPLPKHLHVVVLAMAPDSRPWTTSQIRGRVADPAMDQLGPTCLNNRLARLEQLGLVQRAGKDGREQLWQLTR